MKSACLGALVLIPALLSACGEPASPADSGSGAPSEASEAEETEAISFGVSLAQIRGHHLVSLELYEGGDVEGAALHASHPIAEILDSVSGELEGRAPGVAVELADQLDAGTRAIAAGRAPARLAAIYEDVAATTDRAEKAVVGQEAAEPSFKGSVISALLATAGHEYEEALGKKGIRLVAEYQDGYAFVQEGRRLYAAIADEARGEAAEEAEEIEDAFGSLDQALRSPRPPQSPVAALEVTSATELIGHELEETVGATPAAESDPETIVAEIEELLDEIVQSYEAGNTDEAAELSAEAYLENYEVIEAEVIELAPEVNDELEPLLGAELRRQINAEARLADIKEMVGRARKLLHEALAAIEGHH